MDIKQAKQILNSATRYELRDHAFGDTEVTWENAGIEIGGGYFGSGIAEVFLNTAEDVVFRGELAHQLRSCGHNLVVERNDETGPEQYNEGVTMPGLTLEGVRRELCGE